MRSGQRESKSPCPLSRYSRTCWSRRIFPLVVVCLLSVGVLTACGKVKEHGLTIVTDRQIKVVATTGMIGDVAAIVGGDRVDVRTMMGAAVDPHLYKASEGAVQRLAAADIVLFNGLHLEAGLAEVLERMGDRSVTVAVTDRIPRELLHSPPEFAGHYDPHVWFDVTMWKLTVEVIRDTYIAMDPGHAVDYKERAIAYAVQLDELDAYVRAQAARLPAENRILITAHDAFGYFGAQYGFEVRGLQGISTATEAGTGDVQKLAEFITERRIPAIFVESSVPRRTVEALREAVKSRGWNVQIGGQLFSDAMGDKGTYEGTYIGMVRTNTDTIVSALLGLSAEEPA